MPGAALTSWRSGASAVATDNRDQGQHPNKWSHDKITADTLLRLIDALIEQRQLSTGAAAHALDIHPRTLHRNLSQLGLSFRGLVARRRHALAIKLLAEPICCISDIADRLGFRDAASFDRAFHRWHGKSLAKYRSDVLATSAVADQRGLGLGGITISP
jgi:AraC-like DNA-binding protein